MQEADHQVPSEDAARRAPRHGSRQRWVVLGVGTLALLALICAALLVSRHPSSSWKRYVWGPCGCEIEYPEEPYERDVKGRVNYGTISDGAVYRAWVTPLPSDALPEIHEPLAEKSRIVFAIGIRLSLKLDNASNFSLTCPRYATDCSYSYDTAADHVVGRALFGSDGTQYSLTAAIPHSAQADANGQRFVTSIRFLKPAIAPSLTTGASAATGQEARTASVAPGQRPAPGQVDSLERRRGELAEQLSKSADALDQVTDPVLRKQAAISTLEVAAELEQTTAALLPFVPSGRKEALEAGLESLRRGEQEIRRGLESGERRVMSESELEAALEADPRVHCARACMQPRDACWKEQGQFSPACDDVASTSLSCMLQNCK